MDTEKKQILLYTNYFYPETASLAMLCKDLCDGLKDEFHITVVCSVPCYTGAVEERYRTQKYYYEDYDGIQVIRVRVPSFNKQNKLSRIRNILACFFRSVLATGKAPEADYVLAESQPPVLGGLLGVFGKWVNRLRGKKAKMLYIIQDYNPEQTMAVGFSKNRLVLGAMLRADTFSCSQADKAIVVGSDMVPTMEKRFTKKDGTVSRRMPPTVFINNWMDGRDAYPLPKDHPGVAAFRRKYGLEGKFAIMYSGNIGLFYDLENLFRVIEKFKDREDVVFPFVGEGSKKEALMAYAREHGMANVVFIPYQPKEELAYSLNAADVHWIVNARGIKGVSCPSKLYGILAVGKPALAVLEEGTEARAAIEGCGCGYAVSPGDYRGVEGLIRRYIDHTTPEGLAEMGARGHAYMQGHLTKEISIEKYRREIRSC